EDLPGRLDHLLEAAATDRYPVPPVEFLCHVAARLGSERTLPESLDELQAADLYLAFACLREVPSALRDFDDDVLGPAIEKVLRIGSGDAFDELRQAVRERLLMPNADKPAKLAEYGGRGR